MTGKVTEPTTNQLTAWRKERREKQTGESVDWTGSTADICEHIHLWNFGL